MPNCGIRNVLPSYCGNDYVGFGSDLCRVGTGYGYGGYGGYGASSGGTASAACLGKVPGVEPKCINQVPSIQCTLQAPPVVVSFPGPVLASTPCPLKFSACSPCSARVSGSGLGYGGLGYGGYGYGNYGVSSCGYGGFLGQPDYCGQNACVDICN